MTGPKASGRLSALKMAAKRDWQKKLGSSDAIEEKLKTIRQLLLQERTRIPIEEVLRRKLYPSGYVEIMIRTIDYIVDGWRK